MTDRLSPEQWSDYWRAGSITTFMGRFANNYDGVVLEFWRKVFDALPHGSRIVDLATGNGALALLASQYSEARDAKFELTGVDFAATDPKETLQNLGIGSALERIRFLTSTRIEETGLPDRGFDLVCSQFGFEYAAREPAVREAVRLMADGRSVFAVMLHREDSAVVAQAREGVRQTLQCRNSGIVEAAKRLLEVLDAARARGENPAGSEACEERRTELNRITGKLHNAQSQYEDPGQLAWYMGSVMALFSSVRSGDLSTGEKMQRMDEIDAEAVRYVERMRDLMASALSQGEIDALAEELEEKGLTVDYSENVEFEGKPFCHALIAVR
ncbi:MAG: class I SAM-dependent methyltransferase [Proteobacteria bacterium]|nr:class I SAM-dependent methyltransferase [Pseudomonadota bacterium]